MNTVPLLTFMVLHGQSTNGVNSKQVDSGFDTVNHATGGLDVSKLGHPQPLVQSGTPDVILLWVLKWVMGDRFR